jgi:hypothetical protein
MSSSEFAISGTGSRPKASHSCHFRIYVPTIPPAGARNRAIDIGIIRMRGEITPRTQWRDLEDHGTESDASILAG